MPRRRRPSPPSPRSSSPASAPALLRRARAGHGRRRRRRRRCPPRPRCRPLRASFRLRHRASPRSAAALRKPLHRAPGRPQTTAPPRHPPPGRTAHRERREIGDTPPHGHAATRRPMPLGRPGPSPPPPPSPPPRPSSLPAGSPPPQSPPACGAGCRFAAHPAAQRRGSARPRATCPLRAGTHTHSAPPCSCPR